MKQYQLLGLGCILLYCSLLSCSKNNDQNPALTPTPTPPKYSTTLLKVYEIDSTKQAPNDTISTWFFSYDIANRPVKDSFISISLYPNGSAYARVKTIQYNGNDTFASRSIEKRFTPSQFLSTDTTYYTFINGNYVKDTVVFDYGTSSPRGSAKNELSYFPGVIIRNFQNWIPQYNYSATEQHTIYQTIVNGNIVRQIDTLRTYVNGQNPGLQTFETTVSYLPNPNPFYKIFSPTAKKYFTGIGIGNSVSTQYAPEHLISQQISSSDNKVTYEYTFRTDGYPLTARVTFETNGSKSVTKLLFVYAQN